MRKFLSFAAVAALFATFTFGSANAGDRDFVIHNHTRFNITGMNIAPLGMPWRHINNVFVPPGGSESITVYDDGGNCQLGFQLFWPQGVYSTFSYGFDFCDTTDVTVFEDSYGTIRAFAD